MLLNLTQITLLSLWWSEMYSEDSDGARIDTSKPPVIHIVVSFSTRLADIILGEIRLPKNVADCCLRTLQFKYGLSKC